MIERTSEMEELVDNGIDLLDHKGPEDWRSQVDLDKLDLGSCSSCILGQLYGSFSCGVCEIDLWDTVGYGFDHGYGPFDPDAEEYMNILTEIWKEKLQDSK